MVCICNLCGVCLVVTRQLLSNDTEQRHPCHDGRLHQSLLLHLPRSRCLGMVLFSTNLSCLQFIPMQRVQLSASYFSLFDIMNCWFKQNYFPLPGSF
ncbi:hypothetical protein SORBI_3001G245500 [Sorghum bicolor]|uniref:Secreted protein n=1 Tax=Sorghum bicolor TaxID=4558 RepID=A0A1B6QKS2_SORBI|nr:hypothetical protein SORBI_3001G245500 [Sorghum bicolor]